MLRKEIVLRRKLILFLICMLAFGWKGTTTEAASIPVIKNGAQTKLKGTIVKVRYGKGIAIMAQEEEAPVIKIGSTIYAPCKNLFSERGILDAYIQKGSQVTLWNGARNVTFYANKNYAKVNGTKMKLKANPYFVTFQTSDISDMMVPLDQAASFLGLKYSYDSKTKTVVLGNRPGIYQSATKDTAIAKSRFIQILGPIARENYKRTGVLASVTMAQAILESGWGQSSLAKQGNNLFGMKAGLSGNNWAGSAWDGVNVYKKKTSEYGSRGRYRTKASFRKYSCVEDSIEDHSSYLLNAKNGRKKRYAGLTKTKSYKKQLKIIRKGGYCTSSSYVNQLTRVIRTYKLTRFDKK